MKKLILTLLFAASTACYAQIPGVEHVVLIASDGFSAEMLRENEAKLPNISALKNAGSWTLDCRSVLPSSSAVNWATHLMGAGPEIHGYTTWGSAKPDLPPHTLTKNGMFPCIMWTLREKFPQDKLVALYSWETIGCLFDTLSVTHHQFYKTDEEVTDNARKWLKEEQPRFSFFYLAEPDHTGHTYGWRSPEYLTQCIKIDSLVGKIVEGIKDADMAGNTAIVFIADHGGINKGHGGISMSEMQVPYIVVGPGVKKNFEIPERMMNFDDAATIAYILGAERPAAWIGRPVTSIFEEATPTNTQNLSVKAGKPFSITLAANPTTGYVWKVKTMEGEVKLLSQEYSPKAAPKGMTGVGGNASFAFQSLQKGTATITLELKRPWENAPAKAEVFTVKMK